MAHITKEHLLQRLQLLEQGRNNMTAQLNSQLGAIEDCKQLLAELEQLEAAEETEVVEP